MNDGHTQHISNRISLILSCCFKQFFHYYRIHHKVIWKLVLEKRDLTDVTRIEDDPRSVTSIQELSNIVGLLCSQTGAVSCGVTVNKSKRGKSVVMPEFGCHSG